MSDNQSLGDRRESSGRRDSDPPLFLSGRNFVTISRAGSDISGGQNRTGSSQGAAEGPQLTSVGQDSMGTLSTVHVDLTHSEEHEQPEVIVSSHATPAPSDLPDDEEVHATVRFVKQHQAVIEQEGKQIEWLELTGRQLNDMVNDVDGSCKIEYFDSNYFTSEAQKVWQDRQQGDLSPERSNKVRLLTTGPSSILAARSNSPPKMFRSGPGAGSDSVTTTHPLIHRKAQQNEERRAAFRAAALERRPSTGQAGDQASAASIYLPQRHLFECPPLTASKATAHTQTPAATPASTVKSAATDDASFPQKLTAGDETATAATETSAPAAVAAGPKSLTALLQEQRTLLASMKDHDERVYQPLLSSYFKYEGHVQEKLTRILNMAIEPKAPGQSTDA